MSIASRLPNGGALAEVLPSLTIEPAGDTNGEFTLTPVP